MTIINSSQGKYGLIFGSDRRADTAKTGHRLFSSVFELLDYYLPVRKVMTFPSNKQYMHVLGFGCDKSNGAQEEDTILKSVQSETDGL